MTTNFFRFMSRDALHRTLQIFDMKQSTNNLEKSNKNLATVKCEFSHDRYADRLTVRTPYAYTFTFDKLYNFGFDVCMYIFRELSQMCVVEQLNRVDIA